MKKGQIIGLEMLVKFLPHLIVAIVIFAVFVMLVNSFITKQTTPEMEDFERINSEFKALLEAPYPGVPISITVPVQRDSPLSMVVYSAETSPLECRKNTCICLYPKGEGKPICNIYPDIKTTCGSTCGTVCIANSYPVEKKSPTSITITRNCNEITLS